MSQEELDLKNEMLRLRGILLEQITFRRQADLLENVLDQEDIEAGYQEQVTKLATIENIVSQNNFANMSTLKSLFALTMSEDISIERKIDSLICAIAVIGTYPQINLNVEQWYLLSNTMISIPVDNYGCYIQTVANPNILNSTLGKSESMKDKLDIMEDVLNYCDDIGYPNMSDEACKNAERDCLGLIQTHTIERTKS